MQSRCVKRTFDWIDWTDWTGSLIPFLKILEENHLFCLTTKKAFYERDNVSKFRINPHLHCFLSNLFTILSQVEVQSLVNGKTNVSETFCFFIV